MSEKYFGPGSTLVGDATGLTLFIPAATLLNPGLLDSPVGASEDKLAIALVNCLFSGVSGKSEDPAYKIAASSNPFPGRTSVGDPAQNFDTFDFQLQVRTPSSGGSLPDPDELV
jgi:hypothetical protein